MAKRKTALPAAAASPAPGVAASNRLADLAGRIRDAEAGRARSSLAAAEQTLEAGRLLLEAKEACRHGEWLPFLELAGIAERQAQRLMLLVRAGLKADTVSELGMSDALDLAAKRKLPEAGEVLMLSIGGDVGEAGPGAEARSSLQGAVLIWPAVDYPGHFHVVGWTDANADRPAEIAALGRPISGERPDYVFAVADMMLGGQSVTTQVAVSGDLCDLKGLLVALGRPTVSATELYRKAERLAAP